MPFNLLSKTLPSFGLDVSSGSLKLVQLEQKNKKIKIKGYSESSLPKGLIVGDSIVDVKTFSFLLKQSLNKPQFGRFDTNYVVASLPESKSFVRVIQIPQMSDAEAESAVPFEAESFIPLPVDQVYLDWQKIATTAGQSSLGAPAEDPKMNILMIASPKEFVDKYLDILEKVGLRVAALEVESQSCVRSILPKDSQETSLLIDLGGFRSSLVMIEDGNLQFTSTIPIAGNTFTESIARALGVASPKAEEIKKKVGIANTTEYPNIKTELLPVLNSLSAEIKNILKFHNEHSTKQVERVIISGSSGKLKNIAEFLLGSLGDAGITKVVLADPLQNLGIPPAGQLSALEALSFVTALGLAHRGINYNAS